MHISNNTAEAYGLPVLLFQPLVPPVVLGEEIAPVQICYENKDTCTYVWQYCVEIEDYSVKYFECIATFKMLYH